MKQNDNMQQISLEEMEMVSGGGVRDGEKEGRDRRRHKDGKRKGVVCFAI